MRIQVGPGYSESAKSEIMANSYKGSEKMQLFVWNIIQSWLQCQSIPGQKKNLNFLQVEGCICCIALNVKCLILCNWQGARVVCEDGVAGDSEGESGVGGVTSC